jgi:hypothetical protein
MNLMIAYIYYILQTDLVNIILLTIILVVFFIVENSVKLILGFSKAAPLLVPYRESSLR